MQLSTILVSGFLLRLVIANPVSAVALGQNDAAEAYYNAFNKEFLITSGSDVYYKSKINDPTRDGTWAASLDILGAEDAYERTGDPDKKTLVNNLLTTWLKYNPEQASSTPWSWDGWNDDIGWFTLALIRGYQITGTQQFLNAAKNGFDYASRRGWETAHNEGGIWEEQPDATAKENPPREATKEALSNDSLGKVACMIYQSTHDQNYLDKCQQIYNWVLGHIYNAQTGQIDTGVDQSGKIDTGAAAYNQGTFLDYSNLLYTITGNGTIYTIAQKAAAFARTDPSLTKNGIFSNSADYLNTWADEMARGIGHFVRDNRLWGTYYAWMSSNAASILKNRRTDKGITWNAWDTPTPLNDTYTTNKFVSALAWLQFTPPTQPNDVGGIRIISNQKRGSRSTAWGNSGMGRGSCSGVRTAASINAGSSRRTPTPRGISSMWRLGRRWSVLGDH
ncbi:hypothetical protein G7Y79_00014g037540 [Physcia stellaris]|nr:hypothetical protein G7Y79_00014g037540 [Physcia stellaris]